MAGSGGAGGRGCSMSVHYGEEAMGGNMNEHTREKEKQILRKEE